MSRIAPSVQLDPLPCCSHPFAQRFVLTWRKDTAYLALPRGFTRSLTVTMRLARAKSRLPSREIISQTVGILKLHC